MGVPMRYQHYLVLTFSLLFFTTGNVFSQDTSKNLNYLKQSYLLEKKTKNLPALKSFIEYKSENAFFIKIRLGWLYYLNNLIGNSISNYKDAIELQPRSIDAHLGLFNCYLYLRKYDDSKELLLSILKWNSGNVKVLENLALIHYYQKNKKKQLETLMTLLEYYPANVRYLNLVLNIHQELGNKKKVDFYLKKVKSISPRIFFIEEKNSSK